MSSLGDLVGFQGEARGLWGSLFWLRTRMNFLSIRTDQSMEMSSREGRGYGNTCIGFCR